MKAKLAVLISGNGSNLQAIMDAVAAGSLDAQIVVVVSNRKKAYGLERARQARIPDRYFPLKPYRDAQRSRAEYDADLAALVSAYAPDWVVLAGWMHILSEQFLGRFPNRVVNLHPALPGQFPGRACHRRRAGGLWARRNRPYWRNGPSGAGCARG